MSVYIANFGLENYQWPGCLSGNYIATMQDERVHPYWSANDRQGYIDFCVANLTTAKGIAPTRPVAGRWFNLGTIIVESQDDLWLHRQGELLWWTTTTSAPATITLGPDLKPLPNGTENVYYYRKPARPWSNQNRKGNRLEWKSLHPKVRDFLVTEATLQQLGPDYAAYAITLIDGDDLSAWHQRPEWKAKLATAAIQRPGTIFNARQKTFANIAIGARDTAANAYGQTVSRQTKVKEFRFASVIELERYAEALFEAQEGLCALTALPLQFLGGDDHQMCCSLDRIDSDGHYEKGNLQIVCKFINRWKSDTEDPEFRRLIEIVRNSAE